MAKTENIMTPEFRVSFPYVFRPQKAMEAGKEDKYSLVCLFPLGADLTTLKNAVLAAIHEKWGTDKTKWPTLTLPFRDQGEKTQEGYVKGAVFMTPTSKQRPGLVDQAVQPIIDQTQFYAGCYAKATVRVFTYEVKGQNGGIMKRGVSFGLQNVQKTRDGESLSGRVNAEKEFAPIADTDGGAPASAADVFNM